MFSRSSTGHRDSTPKTPLQPHSSIQPTPQQATAMTVYALLIISKAGGLIYNRSFHPNSTALQPLGINDLLNLAGTFHGIHAISRTLCPDPVRPAALPAAAGPRQDPAPGGVEALQTSRFAMWCAQTATGIKFLLFTEPVQRDVEGVLRRCHELYADFVMKNPFYSLEMPIRCEKFERAVNAWIGVR